jgi:hypothetical protein
MFRVVHSGGFTGAEDYGAVAQLRDATRRWVVVAHGDVAAHPPLDASGRFVAFNVGHVNPAKRSVQSWVYVVRLADARVLTRLRVDRSRLVSGWLGDQVRLAAFDDSTVQLLDWNRPTPVLVDFAGADRNCLSVWRLSKAPRTSDDCAEDEVLAVSPDGRWAISRDLHWVRLHDGEWLTVDRRPDGVLGRSATFLPDGRVLIDVIRSVSVSGTRVAATVLCSRDSGCVRVPVRHPAPDY